jgi:hypothetical protein
MDNKDIKEVREITGQTSLNNYIKVGWVLLDTFKKTNDNPNDQYMMYCIGWPRDLPAALPQN